MVKRSRIVSKPSSPPPAADQWVTGGGLDPEIQTKPDSSTPSQTPPAPIEAEEEKEKGKPYPHRISFDTTTEQYKRLKRACFEEERSLNDAIREAVEEWLKSRSY